MFTWEDAHEKGMFVRAGSASNMIGTYGVMDLQATPSHLFSCGADGRLVRRAWTTLKA